MGCGVLDHRRLEAGVSRCGTCSAYANGKTGGGLVIMKLTWAPTASIKDETSRLFWIVFHGATTIILAFRIDNVS